VTSAIKRWHPFDVLRKDYDSVQMRVEIPGMTPDEIEVEVKDDILTISGEHEETKEEQDDEGRVIKTERHFGSFSRSMPLPAGVSADDITKTSKDGVLEVTIPVPRAS
jgi:HSP20 family protein